MNHCYSRINSAYQVAPRAALGHSEQVMGHLIPEYSPKLKLCKLVVRISKKWNSEAMEDLRVSYVSFCENCPIPTCNRVSYNNDKLWFTAKLGQLRKRKNHSRVGTGTENLQQQFSENDSGSVRKGLRLITRYKPKARHSFNDLCMATILNEFYC